MPIILIRIELLELEFKSLELKNICDAVFHLVKFQTKGLELY